MPTGMRRHGLAFEALSGNQDRICAVTVGSLLASTEVTVVLPVDFGPVTGGASR